MDPPPPLHHHYQDSIESSSSPTYRHWDDTLPPPKLRMMCSYGGHIIPRPHDKSLCYMGGETRIVVADRHTSLADLCSRLSTTLLNGRQFSLKYQLPTEDLDSLVSLTTDEDLDNMVEEYDRLNSLNPSSKPSRLRLFLFLSKPETAASMGSLLDDAKSETWFVDALNGAGLLPRGFSDSAPIDNLLEPKDGADQDSYMEPEIQRPLNLPDSPLVETTSSFGSSSSSPLMSNLPPIKVKVDHINQMAGLDEQLSQLNVAVPTISAGGGTISDDDRSDHSAPNGGTRKPPLPLQSVQRKFAHDPYGLPSPDSIASDTSIASANCQPKNTFTQEPPKSTPTLPSTTQIHPNTTIMSTINYQIPHSSDITQPPSHTQDQQFYQPPPHYIQHHTPNQPPQPYYHYAPPPSPQIENQQYPMYFLPVMQNHPYCMPMQSNPTDAATITTSSSSAATPPLYPNKISKPDMYVTAAPNMIQVPNNQFQQQYVNVSQNQHHPPATSNGGKYGYEYIHPIQDPVYYSQNQSVPSQYQTMTPASAMMLTQVSSAPDQSAKQ